MALNAHAVSESFCCPQVGDARRIQSSSVQGGSTSSAEGDGAHIIPAKVSKLCVLERARRTALNAALQGLEIDRRLAILVGQCVYMLIGFVLVRTGNRPAKILKKVLESYHHESNCVTLGNQADLVSGCGTPTWKVSRSTLTVRDVKAVGWKRS